MFTHESHSSHSGSAQEPVVIGLFAYASDARRVLHTLHEHNFTPEQLTAAFREPLQADADVPATSGRESGKWFGHLRQIYRADNAADRTELGVNENAFGAILADLDLSEQDRSTLNQDLNRGAALVAVQAGARNQEAQQILEARGARLLHSPLRSSARERETSNPVAVSSAPFAPPQTVDADHIQLFGEVLRVHKEKVSSGEVHVSKESVTRMETVQVPVTREHLVVAHTGENGTVDVEGALRIPLSEERVFIDKETVLREEYKVGKREVTNNQSVNDTVRRERLLIDDGTGNPKE